MHHIVSQNTRNPQHPLLTFSSLLSHLLAAPSRKQSPASRNIALHGYNTIPNFLELLRTSDLNEVWMIT